MDKKKVRAAVIDTLKELVDPDEKPKITDKSNPIAGLGLESDDGLEFACIISKKLNFHLDDKINPFVNDDGNKARSVGEIVSLISSCTLETVGTTNE